MNYARIPSPVRIGRSDETEELYRLEAERNRAINAVADERGKLANHSKDGRWTHTMPQALLDVLESYDTTVAVAAAVGFLRGIGFQVSEVGVKTSTYGRTTFCVVGQDIRSEFVEVVPVPPATEV
jgi:hypothetical protein